MLATQFSLYDVDDVPAFIVATIRRAGIHPAADDEIDELMLEGLAIMCELADRFEPHRPGYAKPGRFSGYAAQMLPRRLGDAWHRAHPEHRYVTDATTGRRRWVYDQAPTSLDAITDTAPNARHTAKGGEFDQYGGDNVLASVRRIHEFIPLPIPSGMAA